MILNPKRQGVQRGRNRCVAIITASKDITNARSCQPLLQLQEGGMLWLEALFIVASHVLSMCPEHEAARLDLFLAGPLNHCNEQSIAPTTYASKIHCLDSQIQNNSQMFSCDPGH